MSNVSESIVYPAVFDNIDNDGYYSVTFPDIPDTSTYGSTLAEAIKRAPDAIAVALPDYNPYPLPSDLVTIQRANPGKIVSLVVVDLKTIRQRAHDTTIRKNVTIPQSLAIKAKKAGINFSATLTAALEAKLRS